MDDATKAGGGKPELLTPELKSMWTRRHHAEMEKLSEDEKKAFNKQLRLKLEKMSSAELATTRATLQKEWDALPAETRKKKEQRIAAKAKAV